VLAGFIKVQIFLWLEMPKITKIETNMHEVRRLIPIADYSILE
jgi:hypothetical protein